MNRRGLVMAKNVLRRAHSRTTKLLTIHSRSAPVFLSNARGEPTFGPCRQKGFNKPHSSLCAKKVLIPGHETGVQAFVSWCFRKLPKKETSWRSRFCGGGGQKSFKTSSWWIASWGCGIFFRRFFCFQVVLRRSILIPRRLGSMRCKVNTWTA